MPRPKDSSRVFLEAYRQTKTEEHQAWSEWVTTPEGTLACLQCPQLAVAPGRRSGSDILEIIQYRIRQRNLSKPRNR